MIAMATPRIRSAIRVLGDSRALATWGRVVLGVDGFVDGFVNAFGDDPDDDFDDADDSFVASFNRFFIQNTSLKYKQPHSA